MKWLVPVALLAATLPQKPPKQPDLLRELLARPTISRLLTPVLHNAPPNPPELSLLDSPAAQP